ncbi:MAG: lipid-binding protein [Anaerovoracaceae bacterium]
MNKILYLLSTVAVILLLVACQKQPKMGTTAISPMDGEWRVKIYAVVADTQVYSTSTVFKDTSTIDATKGMGKLDTTYTHTFTMYTTNTAANDNDSLIIRFSAITYQDTFPTQKLSAKNGPKSIVGSIIGKIGCNVDAKTFSITDGDILPAKTTQYTISEGKILLNVAHPPSGVTADSIVFFIDKRGTNTTKYKVTGYRRTFWSEDDSWGDDFIPNYLK